MTLTAFTEGPQQTKGRGTSSCGQCREVELNNMNFCKASLQVARIKLHKHEDWPQIT